MSILKICFMNALWPVPPRGGYKKIKIKRDGKMKKQEIILAFLMALFMVCIVLSGCCRCCRCSRWPNVISNTAGFDN